MQYNSFNSIKVKLSVVLFVWIYVTILIFTVYKLSFSWGYLGINFFVPTNTSVFFVYSIALGPLYFMPKTLFMPSHYINIYLYLFTFLPAVSVPFFLIDSGNFNFDYYIFLCVFLVCMIYLLRGSKLKKSRIISFKPISKKLLPSITVTIYCVAFLLFFMTFGVKFTMPDFSDIYMVRESFKHAVSDSFLTKYLVGWMGYVVNIFLLLYALTKKNKVLLIFSFVFQCYIFSLMALKSHLATYFLAIILFYILNKYKKLSTVRFILLTISFLTSISIIGYIFDNDFFEMLITRRIMIVPSQLTYYHFDFFNNNPKTHWGYSIFKNIFDYPYELPPPNIIGDLHFGNPDMTAVVNLFMEGYSAFGYLGVIAVTLILKFLLNVIDGIFIKSSFSNIVIVLLLCLCNILNSSSIFIVLLTHGWIILILTTLFFPWQILKK